MHISSDHHFLYLQTLFTQYNKWRVYKYRLQLYLICLEGDLWAPIWNVKYYLPRLPLSSSNYRMQQNVSEPNKLAEQILQLAKNLRGIPTRPANAFAQRNS